MDQRISLNNGCILCLAENRDYTIEQEIGRGASCIVYDASYRDNLGEIHRVRIKECYPFELNAERDAENGLIVPIQEQKAFEIAKDAFCDAYRKNTKIKREWGLVNSTVNVLDIYEKNNTLYTIMSYDEGIDYSHEEDEKGEKLDKDLQSVFIRIKAVAQVIDKYHKHGLLHLDIKPANIMVVPEQKDRVLLFDFDSMVSREDLKSGSCLRIGFSDGFSAPEQTRGIQERISEATDIYALGALLFYKSFGRKPISRDCRAGSNYDFSLISDVRFKDVRYRPKLFQEMERFLHKTLTISMALRWKTMGSVLECLDDLIRLSDVESN